MSYGRKRNEKKEKIIEVVYRNILFKCIYLWWRLYDRIFDEEEVDINSIVKEFLTVQKEGNRKVERKVKYYNLDMII